MNVEAVMSWDWWFFFALWTYLSYRALGIVEACFCAWLEKAYPTPKSDSIFGDGE